MRKTILILAVCAVMRLSTMAATVFTEFYTDYAVGTNINSGSTTNAAATYTSVNGNFNGSTTFTPTDGSTPASTVNVGDWAAIYIDNSTNLIQTSAGGYITRVLSVAAGVNGAIGVSTTAFMGTAPSSSATARSIKVGGAWNGPYGTIGFPFGFFATTGTNASNIIPRCNLKKTSTYNVTAAMTHANVGPARFQGMTLVPGDGGMATIDGGTAGSEYIVLNVTGVNNDFEDLIFNRNGGASGGANMVTINAAETLLRRVVFSNSRRTGVELFAICTLIECEAFGNNTDNVSTHAGFKISSGGIANLIRCISHDNTGSSNVGVYDNNVAVFFSCIFESNGGAGVTVAGTTGPIFSECDFYKNVGSGIDVTVATADYFYAENCNFITNGVNGINFSSSGLRNGLISNCGFGSGTMTNTSGSISANVSGVVEIGSIIYAANQTPWQNPDNGDFRIVLSTAKSAGRGTFTETAGSYSGTVGYPDIGAAQSASTNATTRATAFSQ